MSNSHLGTSERNTLYELHTIEKLPFQEIATKMKRSKSMISRELKQNRSNTVRYLPDTAQAKMKERRQQSNESFMSVNEASLENIKQRLEEYHSPEQISGRMKREGFDAPSYETIYRMIYKHQGLGAYQCYLRQAHKQSQRRKDINRKRGGMPRRMGIEHHPEIAEQKTDKRHWESDTVIGVNHPGIIVTQDKASKFLFTGLAKNKTVQQVNEVTKKLFSQIDGVFRKTMTFDNGTEFSGQQKLADALNLLYFFANPYHSWKREFNEHTNRLRRQFFPKSTNFKIVKPEALNHVID
jgi:transposase, IS30 family